MLAHELAKLLLAGPDVRVVVRGYEGGVNDVSGISEPSKLALDFYDEWYYGHHQFVGHDYDYDEEEATTKGCKFSVAIQIC
jgi:hypothetical protein